MMQRTSQTNSQPTLKSQKRSLYRLRYTRQTPKITRLTSVQQVVWMKRRMKMKRMKRMKRRMKMKTMRSGMSYRSKWKLGKSKLRYKQVMQLKPFQAGRNFKPIFIVDVTRD